MTGTAESDSSCGLQAGASSPRSSESIFSSPNYQKRIHLSAVEAAKYLGTTAKQLHCLAKKRSD